MTSDENSPTYARGLAAGREEYRNEFHFVDMIQYWIVGTICIAAIGLIGFGIWHFIHWAAQQDQQSPTFICASPSGIVPSLGPCPK